MKQKITIRISKNEYPLEIESEMEEKIRAAAQRVNNEIESLSMMYRDVDMKDILSVVLLSEEKKLVEAESKSNIQISDTLRQVEELDAYLGEYLLSR